jgi:hypothetical protein
MRELLAIGVGLGAALLMTRLKGPTHQPPETCEYRTYAWSTREGRVVDRRTVEHPYSQVAGDERSPVDSRCTICEGDQTWVELPGVAPFQVCWAYAADIESALLRAMQRGAVIEEVVAYRPGRTGGPLDSQGRRTEYGSHAYGLALDVNPDQNGMYSGGRLRHGGAYRPQDGDPRTITRSSPIYQELQRAGFGWAGDHRQELGYDDWMHFSRTGR